MIDIHTATNKIFDRVHRTGEEIKNDLPNWVERFVEAKGWTKVIDPATGKPFENVGQWLVANYPLGPGMGQGRYAISYDEFIALCDERPKLKDMLVRYRPKGKRGGDRGNQHTGGKVDNVKDAKPKTGNSRLYIEERLQRDHPEIWQEYLSGHFKSARQAAIAAGIRKKPSHNDTALKAFRRSQDRVGLLRDILSVLVAEGDQQALYEVQAAVEGLQKESPKKKATKGVRIDSGPVEATDKFEQVPKDRWRTLMRVKRDFLSTNLAYDCRCLVEFCEEAELAYADCGFNSAAEMIQQGYELDATKIELAVALLKSINRLVDRDVDTQTVEEIARSMKKVQP